jgi:eukaryotic-like serine/threonine-protein kinase
MPRAPFASGDLVGGKYRVERVLGEGGMGVVLGARHTGLDERVAIKVLKPEATQDAKAVSRFLREARASVRMKGEHVARVFDVGALEDGTPFIVMEQLQGTELGELVDNGGVLPVTLAVDYVIQICEALAEAHAHGIIHRDIKPSNLFLTTRVDGSPCVKVLDFGISKVTHAIETARSDFNATETQSLIGSPQYMAPEQMRSSRRVDARTDVWALGTVMHELLTGSPPFVAQSMPELFAMILQDPAPSLRSARADVPPGLEAAVARCLEKAPDHRPSSVLEVAQLLSPFGSAASAGATERIARVAHHVGTISAPDLPSATSTGELAHASSTAVGRALPAGGGLRRAGVLAALAAALALGAGGIALILLSRAPGAEALTPPRAEPSVADERLAPPPAASAPSELDPAMPAAPPTELTAPIEPTAQPVKAVVGPPPTPRDKSATGPKRPPPRASAAASARVPAPPASTPSAGGPPPKPPPVSPAATASSRYD